MSKKSLYLFSALLSFALVLPSATFANNLVINNVNLGVRNTAAKTLNVTFDVSWENSWRNKINHDALWLIIRLHDTQSEPTDRRLCRLYSAGLSPAGTSIASSSGLQLFVPADKRGAFLRPSSSTAVGPASAEGVTMAVDYASCGFSETSQIAVTVLGFEMVFVPTGSFYAGDFATSVASFQAGSADNDPWNIVSEDPINVTATSAQGYYYVSAGNPGEFPTGSSFNIGADFPKGYHSFYAMKYEITEGQWVDFINSLPSSAARAARDLTDNLHKNTDSVVARNTISCSGSPIFCTTQRPARALSYLMWPDFAAFLDWAALRPMSELEFEKLTRGPFVPVKGEYAWGSIAATGVQVLSGELEDGAEAVMNLGANARFDNVLLTGGDAAQGIEYQSGPVRGGIFATGDSDRIISGAGYYGAMELSGNLQEWTVSVGSAVSLSFDGEHGDGLLTSLSGHEGRADVLSWPGMDDNPSFGVTSADGMGSRGGSWESAALRLRISDRQDAAKASAASLATYGGRGVRSYDGE